MPDILLHDISQETLDAVENQVEKHNRTVEQELVAIVEQAALAHRTSCEEAIRLLQEIQILEDARQGLQR